ncbi:transporter substrate-binding domain-containing protein [Vibrio sp. YMD68]|uniref:substrate-binding periplasmic protein n=1 Tax=Vibrio sp. YMD68 TaxID=3042300 RepID=UPI00249CA4F4|nr:transporter substrate-binding domain-containing protein [Vibrio sp. YMD68]WGV99459.1 transporter substrate-binding domain-containing protein [Vibrio sp. YMD68]
MYRSFLLLAWSAAFFSGAVQSQYRIITEDFRPFAYPTENGKVDGMAFEIVDWLLDDLNIDSDIEVLPWSRGISLTRTKENHVLFSVARTKEREKWFKWVGPFYSDKVSLYQLNEQQLSDKENIKENGLVVVSKGYPEEQILRDEGYQNIVLSDNSGFALQMLIKRRGDYFPIGHAALPCLLAKNNLEATTLRATDVVLLTSHLYLAMSPNTSNEEVARWQRALDNIKRTERYQEIIENHARHCQ